MKKLKAASWLVVLVSGLLLISTAPSFGGDNKSGESENSQSSEKSNSNSNSNELASTYGSKYWGNPSKEISNSKDQEDYDRGQAPIPGIEVAGSEVFSTFKGRQGAAAVIGGTGDLIDHGGQVLNEIHIYPIFWGAATATFTQGYKDAINNFFTSIQCGAGTPTTVCTGHSDLVKQYFRTSALKNTSPIIKYVRSFSDTTAPPSSSPSTASIAAEAAKVVKANNLSLDPLGFYIIFTNNYPSRVNFCAWHSAGSYKATTKSVAQWFTVAYMPFVGNTAGCSAGYIPGVGSNFKNGQAVHSVINVTTHELYETMTDSLINNRYAWYDNAGYENGDKCAWSFPSTINGYLVQSEYSNFTHDCPNLTSN
jgi:hypothetical protein